MRFKIYIAIVFLIFSLCSNGQETPNILDFYNLLGQDLEATKTFLTEHKFIFSDTAAQGKANRTCCSDINFEKKRFYAQYYSNGQTDIQLIIRNDNKLFSVELFFTTKNIKYMHTSETILKNHSFQTIEFKRDLKNKSSYKQLRCNAVLNRRAYVIYSGPDKPDSIIINDWDLVEKE